MFSFSRFQDLQQSLDDEIAATTDSNKTVNESVVSSQESGSQTRQSPKKTSHKAENSTKHRHSLAGIQMRFNQKWKENNVTQASLVLCFRHIKIEDYCDRFRRRHISHLSILIISNRLQLSRRFLFSDSLKTAMRRASHDWQLGARVLKTRKKKIFQLTRFQMANSSIAASSSRSCHVIEYLIQFPLPIWA